MCYSFGASVVAFSVAIITVFFMYNRQTTIDKYIGPLLFIYSFMQLAEAFMWYDTKCGKINKIGTYIAYISLILHVLGAGFGIYLAENKIHGLILGAIIFVYYLIKMPKMKCSKPIKIHMDWGFDGGFYYLIFFATAALYMLSNMKSIYKFFLLTWTLITLIYFFYKQASVKPTLKNMVKFVFNTLKYEGPGLGSTWCHLSAAGAPLFYLIQYVIK